jgi:hypothetical protein
MQYVESLDADVGRELAPVAHPVELPEISLDDRAASINRHLALAAKAKGKFDDHRLQAGRELIEAYKHVPPGRWLEWCRTNFSRSRQDVARVMKLAAADDPEAALEQERARAREGMRASRANGTNVSSIKKLAPSEDVADGGIEPTVELESDLFAGLLSKLDAMPDDALVRFSYVFDDYLNKRGLGMAEDRPKQIAPPSAPKPSPTITLAATEYAEAPTKPETAGKLDVSALTAGLRKTETVTEEPAAPEPLTEHKLKMARGDGEEVGDIRGNLSQLKPGVQYNQDGNVITDRPATVLPPSKRRKF